MSKNPDPARNTADQVSRRPKIRHLALAVSLHEHHGVAIVTVDDPRSDGRPRRMLAGFRIPVGHVDLVGRSPVDAAGLVSVALAEGLSALAGTDHRPEAPAPPGGPRGRPEILRGQMQLPFG